MQWSFHLEEEKKNGCKKLIFIIFSKMKICFIINQSFRESHVCSQRITINRRIIRSRLVDR